MPLTAEISAPSQAALGSKITVSWSGPNRPGDRLTIVTPEVSDSVADVFVPTSAGSPTEFTLPVDPGDFEIRYITANHQVIGRRPLLITIPVTTLSAPDTVTAGATFEVQWRGPDSPADVVTLLPRGTPEGRRGVSTPTANGSPLTLVAPEEGGVMELRYVAGSKALTLARRPIVIRAAR
jgi:Ca-activated chloride channel family protein